MKGILSEVTIYEVTEELIQRIIDSEVDGIFDGPHKLMWFYDDKAKKFIGCDNLDGSAWIEEFDTRIECLAWLLELD
jgi:hypothetical protein